MHDQAAFPLLAANEMANSSPAEVVAKLRAAPYATEFRRAFGESPHSYLLTRRLERAAALLRNTDRNVAEVCLDVGLTSVGSFTTSFKRTFGKTPTAYRGSFPPPATRALVPGCIVRAYARPQVRTFREDSPPTAS